MLKPETVTDR